MFFTYLGELFKRAFTPASRLTDGLQVFAASALPALANFVGLDMPKSAETSVLAYIGLAAVSLVAIRLLWAPYAMWKEQINEVADLKLELSKPERIVLEQLAKLRAKNRLRLVRYLDIMYRSSVRVEGLDVKKQIEEATAALVKAKTTAHKAGLPADFTEALVALHDMAAKPSEDRLEALKFYDLILEYLNDRVTIESLSREAQKRIKSTRPQITPPDRPC